MHADFEEIAYKTPLPRTAANFTHLPYEIDLTLPAEQRWAEIIQWESATARSLVRQALGEMKDVPAFLGDIFGWLYRVSGGSNQEDLAIWAKRLKDLNIEPPPRDPAVPPFPPLSFGTLAAINCGYELDHAEHMLGFVKLGHKPDLNKPGCSTAVLWLEDQGLTHVRTLDWSFSTMGPASRVFTLRRGDHRAHLITFPGFIGAVSGMVPGAYSATINWAPPTHLADFEITPSFLLHETLATCPTFDEAMARLLNTDLATNVFFTLCGIERGEACVIERGQSRLDTRVRWMRGDLLVQTNHCPPLPETPDDVGNKTKQQADPRNARLQSYIDSGDVVAATSFDRRKEMFAALRPHSGGTSTPREVLDALNGSTITNETTCQRMVLQPGRLGGQGPAMLLERRIKAP